MIEVKLAHSTERHVESGPRGRVLYIDPQGLLIWVWLPERLEADYATCVLPDSTELTLGLLDRPAIDGRLAFFEIDFDQFEVIKRQQQLGSVARPPETPLPGVVVLAQSLHDYVHSRDPEADVLRS